MEFGVSPLMAARLGCGRCRILASKPTTQLFSSIIRSIRRNTTRKIIGDEVFECIATFLELVREAII